MKVINNLPVVILAGGQAKRMGGEDKPLIKVEDRPLLSHVLEKISGFASPSLAWRTKSNVVAFKRTWHAVAVEIVEVLVFFG